MIDWDDAFDNSGYVANSDSLADEWALLAREYRTNANDLGFLQADIAYGHSPRERLDFFVDSKRPTKGLVVFIHGGYWHKLDKSYWSHFAKQAIDAGWAMAVPSYPLAPTARIAEITVAIANAITHAAQLNNGPIRLIGHSAGGHLVCRMACHNSPLEPSIATRLQKVIAISGVFDLAPLLETRMNDVLGLTDNEAETESPARQRPCTDLDIIAWTGASERPEFLRQARLLCEAWQRKGARIRDFYEPDKHHFSVVNGLAQADSLLLNELLG